MAGPVRVCRGSSAGIGPRCRHREGPTRDELTHIGLDVHKDTIAVAVLRPGASDCDERLIPNTPEAVRKLLARNPDRAAKDLLRGLADRLRHPPADHLAGDRLRGDRPLADLEALWRAHQDRQVGRAQPRPPAPRRRAHEGPRPYPNRAAARGGRRVRLLRGSSQGCAQDGPNPNRRPPRRRDQPLVTARSTPSRRSHRCPRRSSGPADRRCPGRPRLRHSRRRSACRWSAPSAPD